MPVQFKITKTLGAPVSAVDFVAGDDVTGDEKVVLNFDITDMTKGEAMDAIDELKAKVASMDWPPST